MTSNENTTISVPVKAPASIPTFYVHGVWGGVGPRGEIVVYLYQDAQKLPEQFMITAGPNGALLKDEAPDPEIIERTVLAKLIIPPPIAESVGRFLVGRVEVFNQLHSAIVGKQVSHP